MDVISNGMTSLSQWKTKKPSVHLSVSAVHADSIMTRSKSGLIFLPHTSDQVVGIKFVTLFVTSLFWDHCDNHSGFLPVELYTAQQWIHYAVSMHLSQNELSICQLTTWLRHLPYIFEVIYVREKKKNKKWCNDGSPWFPHVHLLTPIWMKRWASLREKWTLQCSGQPLNPKHGPIHKQVVQYVGWSSVWPQINLLSCDKSLQVSICPLEFPECLFYDCDLHCQQNSIDVG